MALQQQISPSGMISSLRKFSPFVTHILIRPMDGREREERKTFLFLPRSLSPAAIDWRTDGRTERDSLSFPPARGPRRRRRKTPRTQSEREGTVKKILLCMFYARRRIRVMAPPTENNIREMTGFKKRKTFIRNSLTVMRLNVDGTRFSSFSVTQ